MYDAFVLDIGADLFLHIHFVLEEKQLFSKVEIKQNQAMNKKYNWSQSLTLKKMLKNLQFWADHVQYIKN